MMMNNLRFCRLIKPLVSSYFGVGRMHMRSKAHLNKMDETRPPLSLINQRLTPRQLSETERNSISNYGPPTYKILIPGMIYMGSYISLKDQVDIVNMCEKWGGVGPAGFYVPRNYPDGSEVAQTMCFGRNWDPVTKYEKRFRSDDGSEAPSIPSQLVSLAETALQDAQAHLDDLDQLPSMRPDVCVANFYCYHGGLGIHQDRDESSDSLERGLPVVSIFIGYTSWFWYGDDENNLHRISLYTGDVLIFGGKSRLIFQELKVVQEEYIHQSLQIETAIRPGLLNLTLKQY